MIKNNPKIKNPKFPMFENFKEKCMKMHENCK